MRKVVASNRLNRYLSFMAIILALYVFVLDIMMSDAQSVSAENYIELFDDTDFFPPGQLIQ